MNPWMKFCNPEMKYQGKENTLGGVQQDAVIL